MDRMYNYRSPVGYGLI